MKKTLTPAQSEVLRFIEQCCEQHGRPPSYREIQEHFGYKSVGTVQDHVRALQQKGFLSLSHGRSRGLTPANSTYPRVKRLPLYGEVAAGSPRDSAQLEFGEFWVADPAGQKASFALKVVGNSMVEAGIYEGDTLVVDSRSNVKSGDIVVALVDGETTVKRYVETGLGAELHPENSSMKPIRLSGQAWSIQGKVIALHRRFSL